MLYWQAVVNGIGIGSAYAVVGFAVIVVYRTTKIIDFAVGTIVIAIAMVASTVAMWDLPLVVFALTVVAIGAVCGLVYYFVVMRWVSSDNHLVGVMATLAAGFTIQGLVVLRYGTETRTLPQVFPSYSFDVSKVIVSRDVIALVLGSFIAYGASRLLLSGSQFGRSVRAVSDDGPTASLLGINRHLVAAASYAVLGLLAGFAAMLLIPTRPVSADGGFELLVGSVVAITIGGRERLEGAILGGWVVGIIQSLAITAFDALWQEVSIALLLLCVLLWRPDGLLIGLRGRDVH